MSYTKMTLWILSIFTIISLLLTYQVYNSFDEYNKRLFNTIDKVVEQYNIGGE